MAGFDHESRGYLLQDEPQAEIEDALEKPAEVQSIMLDIISAIESNLQTRQEQIAE